MVDSITRELVADTEREIFNDAVGLPDDDDGREFTDEDISDDGLDLPEGWDGEPLEQDEIAATNLYGHDATNNFDRPIALAEEQQRHRELMASNQQLIDADRGYELERQKNAWDLEVIQQPRQAVDIMLQQKAQLDQLREDRINTSMQAAHEAYGSEFERAYENLTSMNPRDPAAQMVVNSITNHPDPGAAIMNWHAAGGAGALGGVRNPVRVPSLNSMQSAGRSFPSDRGGWGNDSSSWGSRSDEEAIFDSVFR